MKKYVIIGNSAAAVGCVEGIRECDKEGSILIVTDEKYHTYSRPLISYLLLGKTDMDRMRYRDADFYEKNGCEVKFGTKALKISPQEKEVILSDGDTVSYDELLIATGSSPFVPPVKGLETAEKKFTFMSLDDALALRDAIDETSRVLILGAGLIGMKCAEGISALAGSITVVDMADRMMPSILDSEASEIMEKHCAERGIKIILSQSIAQINGGIAVLSGGERIDFDVLVIASGVRPNVSLVKEAGGEIRRGIVADSRSRTSLPHVYAAGDCCECRDMTDGQEKIIALLPNAYFQGNCAGRNMAGGDADFSKAVAFNSIGLFGLHAATAGIRTDEMRTEKTDGAYKCFFIKDNRLKGYIIVGDIARCGIYTSLIKNETPLDSLDFELIMKKPQLMAFDTEKRRAALSNT